MDPEGVVRRRRLPHWDVPGAVYFVTTCLHGSIPAQGLLDIEEYRSRLERGKQPEGLSVEEWKVRKAKLVFAQVDEWLDQRPAVQWLEDERLAKIVVDSINHFAGKRYEIWTYVIMPSHFHWVFRARDDWVASLPDKAKKRSPRERIMHTLKLRTALECNKVLRQRGTFWQDESYDHCPRDDEELGRIIEYTELNPVRAGLVGGPEQWRFSSAAERKRLRIPYQIPLPR